MHTHRQACHRLLLIVPLLVIWTPPVSAQRRDTVRIRDRVSCTSCAIKLTPRVSLRLPDTARAWVSPYVFWRNGKGEYLIHDPVSQGGIQVFDRTGTFLRNLVRHGQGPGELDRLWTFVVGQGDSVRAIGSKMVVFNDRGEFVRESRPIGLAQLARSVRLPDDRTILLGMTGDPATFGQPIHVLGADGAISASFGLTREESVRPGIWHRRASIHYSSRWQLLTGFTNRYVIERRDLDGRLVEVLAREAAWFRPWSEWDSRVDERPPPPRLVQLWTDSAGRLWTLTIVADAKWAPGPTRAPGERTLADVPNVERTFDSVIEVIDLSRRTVLARIRRPEMFAGVWGDGSLAQLREDASGQITVVHWSLELLTREGK